MISQIVAIANGTHYALTPSGENSFGGVVAQEISIEEQAAIILSDGECMTAEENEDTVAAAFFLTMAAGKEVVWTKGQYVNNLLFISVQAGAHKRLDNNEYVEIVPADPEGTSCTLRRCYMGNVLWSQTWSADTTTEPLSVAILEAGFFGDDGWHVGLYGEDAATQA